MSSRRVVFVLPRFVVGGAERQLASLIAARPAALAKVDIHLVTFLPTGSAEIEEQFRAAGAKATLVNRANRSFLAFFRELLATMRRLKPDVVSTVLDGSTGTWGRLAAWLTGVPVIVHSDLALAVGGTKVNRALEPLLKRITTRYLPNAFAIKERLMSDGVPEKKIRVIANGVDLTRFNPDSVVSRRQEWGISEEDTVLGFLGRFSQVKRIDLILESVLSLPEHERPHHLLLAGDGELMSEIKARVSADPWLTTHSQLLGALDDTPSFLASVDYLVLASESEGLPNAVLEAMAMGKPVVGTRVSDVPKLIGETGVLAEPKSLSSLTESIATMQRIGSAGREALGAAARSRIEAGYSLEAASERFWKAHLELVENPRHVE